MLMNVKASLLIGKKIMVFALVLMLLLSMYPGISLAAGPDTSWYDPAPGAGSTAADPYVIDTADGLAGLAQLVNGGNNFEGKHIKIDTSSHIDLTGYSNWTPIGTLTNPFKGTFNGNGETVSGLTINDARALSGSQHIALGFFGCIGSGGSVRDLTLGSVDITIEHTISEDRNATSYVGGLIGLNEGTVSGCAVSGGLIVNGVDIRAGGITGKNGSDSGSTGNTSGVIEDCTVNCSITASSCYQSAYVGSVAGGSTGDGGVIASCVSQGSVTVSGRLAYTHVYKAMLSAGGVAGYTDGTSITDCTSSVAVNVNYDCRQALAGGVIGQALQSEIRNCGSSGNISAHGAVSGYPDEAAAGGLIGSAMLLSVIDNCRSTGNAVAEAKSMGNALAGGLVGEVQQFGGTTKISRSYATGTARAIAVNSGNALSGGFGGYLFDISIEKCYSSGSASSSAAAGGSATSAGFAGFVCAGALTDCYSTGDAEANCSQWERCGGFAGAIARNNTFTNCYSAGLSSVAHTGEAFYGGAFIGSAAGTCTVTNCYFDSTANVGLGAVGNNGAISGSPAAAPTYAMTDGGALTDALSGLPDSDWMKRPNTSEEWYYPELSYFGASVDPIIAGASKTGAATAPVAALPMNVSDVEISNTLTSLKITMPVDIGLLAGNVTITDNASSVILPVSGVSYAVGKYTLTLGTPVSYYDTYTITITKLGYVTYTNTDVYYGVLAADGDLDLINEPNIFNTYTRVLSNSVVNVSNAVYAANALIYPDSDPASLYAKLETNNGDIRTPAAADDFRAAGAFVIAPSGALGAKSLYSDGTMTAMTNDDLIDANPNFKETVATGKAAFDSGEDPGNTYWRTIAFAPVYMKTAVKQSNSSWRLNDPADRLRIVEWYDNADCTGTPTKVVRFMMEVEYAGSVQIVPAAPTDPVQDDTNNTFGWTNVSGYTSFNDYQYSMDGGSTWNNATANPQGIPDGSYAIGDIRVRIKADAGTGRGTGAVLRSTEAYTEADTTAPVLSSAGVSNITAATATLSFTSNEAGTYYYLVYEADETAPGAAAIKLQGAAAAKGTGAASVGVNTAGITGLDELTDYKVYVVEEDAFDNMSLVTMIEFTTAAVPDTTAPVLSASGVSNITAATATLSFTSNEAGTYYYLVYEADETAPGAAAIKLQGDAAAKGTGAASVGVNTAGITGLEELTGYKVYVVEEDASANISSVTMIEFTTAAVPDTTAPVLSAAGAGNVGTTTAAIHFSSDEAGTYYYLVYEADETAPDAAVIKLQGTAEAKGTGAASAGTNNVRITGLAAAKAYKVYVVVEDASANMSAVTATEFVTAAAPFSSLTHNVPGNIKVFNTLTEEYGAEARETLTVTLISAGTNSSVGVTLGGTDADSFVLDSAIGTLGNGETGSFTVTPDVGLAAGTYNATVTAFSDEFPAGASFAVQQLVTTPGAFILTATPGSGHAALSWTPVTDAAYYDVYMNGNLTAAVTDGICAYDAAGLVNGITYSFEIKAFDSNHMLLAFSNTVTATPVSVPGIPANVTAAPGNRQAEIGFAAPSDNGGSPITGYTAYVYKDGARQDGLTVTGAAGSPIIVSGLTNGIAYTFTVAAVNAQGIGPESASAGPVTPYAPSTGNTEERNTTPAPAGVDVLVNGKAENAGTVTITKQGDKTVATVTLDEKKLEQRLSQEGSNAVVTIPVNTDSDVAVGELNGQMIKSMEDKQTVVEVRTQTAAYAIPAQQINIEAISQQLGMSVELKDIKVSIEIAKVSEETAKVVENSTKSGEYTVVAPPMEFTIKCTSGGKTVNITSFNAYVERTIAIPAGVDPDKITTGVVIEPDGTVRHVPTRITQIDGKYYAVINSLSNSTYSVVWHPLEFKDADKHWAREAINDMGSRMVISGVGGGMFEPDRDITRAEFAVIMVNGLGLKPGTGKNPFKDVSDGSRYLGFIETAYEYGLISGYGTDIFKPDDKITREQAMAIIARAMKITGLKAGLASGEADSLLTGFGDSRLASPWAREGIAACIKTGILSGGSGKTLEPGDEITRAEVAVILRLLLQKSDLI